MIVTALVENTHLSTPPALQSAWGLAIHIETRSGLRILFDTGPDHRLVENAALLGIDLGAVELVVLSHHHGDHTGGVASFVAHNRTAPVFARRAPLVRRVSRRDDGSERDIGFDLEVAAGLAERLRLVATPEQEVVEGVYLLTRIGTRYARPAGNKRHWAYVAGAPVQDPYDHELVMVVHEDDGMVVFTGCSHSGILNMVEAAQVRFPETPIRAVFGGFHLVGGHSLQTMSGTPDAVRGIGETLSGMVPGAVYSCHCTGEPAFALLRAAMGDQLQAFATGSVVEV